MTQSFSTSLPICEPFSCHCKQARAVLAAGISVFCDLNPQREMNTLFIPLPEPCSC